MFLVGSRLAQKFTNLLDTFTSYAGKAGQYIRIKSTADGLESVIPTIPIATAGGTADAITADYTPDITLSDLTLVVFVASGANTSTTPTFAPDGLAAKTITKKGGGTLLAGDIAGAGFVAIVEYNLTNTRWELLNPAITLDTDGTLVANSDTRIASQKATKTYADTKYAPGGTDVAVTDGGTGASDAATARTNLGAGVGDIKYADTRFKVGSFTRDISLAGAQAITSVGFQPKGIIFFAVVNVTRRASWVMSDASSTVGIFDNWTGATYNDSSSIYIIADSTNFAEGALTSFDSDGFTITWAKTGSPTGTAVVRYIAFR